MEKRTVRVGDNHWEIRDDGARIDYVDLITEARHVEGVVYISLAGGAVDDTNKPIAILSSRLRMNLTSAQTLHKVLGNLINDALKPKDKSRAN